MAAGLLGGDMSQALREMKGDHHGESKQAADRGSLGRAGKEGLRWVNLAGIIALYVAEKFLLEKSATG